MILNYYNIYNKEGGFIDRNGNLLRLGSLIHEAYARDEISNLSIKEQDLYSKWIDFYYEGNLITSPLSFASDFLTMVLGYDKIETNLYHVISTSNSNPYERFYNYILMDYSIYLLPKYIYIDNSFVKLDNKIYDTYVLDEVNSIKKLVPYSERYLFRK